MEKETEVIYISSDDESDSQKENKTEKFLTNSAETNGIFAIAKSDSLLSDNEKVEEKYLKRKIRTEKDEITCNVEKKKKLDDADQSTSKKVINKPGFCSVYVHEIRPVKTNYINTCPNEKEEVFKKAQLIVKEKKKISYVSHDVFPLFISLCLQKCPQSERTDMKKIVDKLKRHYENMDPIYAGSENFVTFINEKREAIMSNDKKIYVSIQEVVYEMKRRINRSNSQASRINEIYDAVPSTSYAANKVPVNNAAESDDDDDSEISDNNEENANPETKRKIKAILHTMKKCEAVIKKLEEEEIDFNDENNSTYIKETRYKQKMVELYTKLCELTGENADAGRVYLRPKHLNVTRIASVDHAITNFINSKITQRNQMKKIGARTNDLIFPDYRDILKCVNRCNDKKKLGLSEKTREQLAEKGFKELGEYLQRVRRNDYWDTFSLYLENKEDPAIKDKDLAKKLANNRIDGEKRLAAVFEKYVQKQAEIIDQNDEEITSEEEEDEEESIVDDEDKNELFITNENDSDIQENKDKTIEDKLPVEKTKPVNMVKVYRAVDKPISNKTTANTVQNKCNEIVEIKARKKSNINAAVSKNEIRTINEKIVHEPHSSNMILQNVKNFVDVKTRAQEDSLPAASTANCTKDLAVAKPKDVSKVITDPAKKRVTKAAADTVTRVTTELTTGDTAELITGDAAELITGNLTETIMEEVITDETEIITETEITDGTIENMPNDEQPEEKKNLLRLRSFAKAPTTWEDSQHKTDKIAQGNAPKVTNQIKEIVDLTSETTATKPPVITKRSVQLGNKIIPITKARQTVLIPANRNIISVQNITNNYLKVNARTGKIIAPVRDIDGSTIIRLPSVQSTSRQIQPQSKIFAFKGNEILRIIPNKSIIIPKNSPVQSVSKQTDVSSSTTKSK